MPVSGIDQAKKNYSRLVDEVSRRKNPRVMQQVLDVGATNAALITPVDTSFLINSQFKRQFYRGDNLFGQVGYTANYARYVSESSGKLKGQARQKRNGRSQGNYWDPNGEPDFLRKGFERDGIQQIKEIILNGLKL